MALINACKACVKLFNWQPRSRPARFPARWEAQRLRRKAPRRLMTMRGIDPESFSKFASARGERREGVSIHRCRKPPRHDAGLRWLCGQQQFPDPGIIQNVGDDASPT